MKEKRCIIILLFVLCTAAAGCARNITDVHMSNSIFLKSPKGCSVYVDIRNTGGQQGLSSIEAKVATILKDKGYKVVNKAEDAAVSFKANVRYTGLAKDANTAVGARAGLGVGGLGGMGAVLSSNRIGDQHVIAGAAAGMVIGALAGYGIEEAIVKSTFISMIDIFIEEQGNPFPHTALFVATLREHGLTMQEAIEKLSDQISMQIAGIF